MAMTSIYHKKISAFIVILFSFASHFERVNAFSIKQFSTHTRKIVAIEGFQLADSLFFASETEDDKPESSSSGKKLREGAANIKLKKMSGDEVPLRNAAGFMVESFWLNSPQNLLIGDSTSALSESTKKVLIDAQASDFADKYGERVGKRLFSSILLEAFSEEKPGETLGIVGIEMSLFDTARKTILNPQAGEGFVKKTISSLGPKQRRLYKNSSVIELAEQLLPSQLNACAVLSNLSVSPNARRMGIAEKLCEEAARFVKDEWKFSKIYLKVEAENIAARGLYESKLGYNVEFSDKGATAIRIDTETGNFEEVGAETVIMSKDL